MTIIETSPQEVTIKETKVKVKSVLEFDETPPPPTCPTGQCKDPITGLCRLPLPDEIIGTDGVCKKIPPPDNHPPVANAGEDKNVEAGSVVTLDGSASTDPDIGDVLSYKWQQTGGPIVVLDTPNAKTARFTAPDINIPPPETKLSPTSIVASVQDTGKEAPLVNDGNFETRWSGDGDGAWIEFTFSQSYKFTKVKLTGYWYDRDYNFEIGGQRFTSPAGRPPNTLQEYNIESLNLSGNKLRIIGHGNSNSTYNSYREIEVYGSPEAPDLTPLAVIVPENPTGQPGVTITVSGVNSKNASQYLWDVDGNLIIKDGIVNQPTAQIILPLTADPDLRVSLTVTNSLGQTNKVTKVVTVQINPPPEQPVAKLSAPSNVISGQNVILDALGSIFDNLTFTQTAGPSVALQIIDAVKRQFTAPVGSFQLAFQLVAQKGTFQAIAQVSIQVSSGPPPPPTEVLWDSNVHLKTGQKYTINSTHGSQDINGKGVFMAASGSPRLIVEANGEFALEADSGHGRVYIQAQNYNARLEGEVKFNDNNIRNTTWRLRSRHNEGGDCSNRFGGFGATCERADQLAEYATESCHNNHENTIKKPLAKNIEVGKWLKFKYSVCNSPDNSRVLFKTEYDYNDGQGWVTVLSGSHDSPQDYYMAENDFLVKRSYAWLRINNESTGSVQYRNVRIVKITSVDQPSPPQSVAFESEEKPIFAPKPIGEIKNINEGLFFVDKPTVNAAVDSNVILTFMLTVTDSKGATNTDSVNVTVTSGPPPPPGDPLAVIKPDNVVGTVGLTTAVSGAQSVNAVSYLWSVAGNGLSIIGANNQSVATLQMPNTIVTGLSVTLTVANSAGKTNSVTKPVTVVNIPPPPTGFNLISWGDDDTTSAAKRVIGKFMTESNVSAYIHAGDGPYASRGTTWVNQQKTFFNTPALVTKFWITQGNHEDEESETEQTQKDIENWLPHLANTPEVAPNQPSWEKTSWLTSGQIGNCFLIMLNSQDQDIEFKGRNQYNWVVKQLEKAKQLRDAGQIDWIICAVHKPHFTLKSSHSPYTAVRQVYREVFRQYQVDIMLHGHNHNYQMWKPMIAITGQDGNQAGQQLFTLKPDGSTYDFSKDHGVAYVVNGNGGHEHNGFNEDPTQNPNIIYANDEDFGYTKLEVNGKDITVKAVHENGTVLHQYKITRNPN